MFAAMRFPGPRLLNCSASARSSINSQAGEFRLVRLKEEGRTAPAAGD
jgi:hypothetical protein